MANQSIIDSVAGSYLPEIVGEQFKILFDDDDEKIYVSYPDILNEVMGSCECRPMQEVALSSVYTDEIENINFDGIFPKPEVGFVDFNFKSVSKLLIKKNLRFNLYIYLNNVGSNRKSTRKLYS